MNKLFLSVAIGTGLAFSAGAQSVSIIKKNGEVIKYKIEEVEKVVFKPAVPFDATNLLSEVYVPCEGFRDWIDSHLGDGSGYYSLEQAAAYTGEINISRVESITDITGIEYFTGLTSLKAEDGYFGDFDVTALKSLQFLQLVNTRVTQLDLSGLKDLKTVFVSRNKLTELIVAGNSTIQKLYCDTNQLTSLDLTGCTGLVNLVCSFNKLASIQLPECPLELLAIHENPIGKIDLSKVVNTLDFVNLNNCGLTSVDFTGATKMTYVDCGDNPLTSAPILAGCKRLETLRMEYVTSVDCGEMDFSDCSKLNVLRLDGSKIGKSINLTSNKKLYELSLQGCNLEEINIAGLINLGYVNVSDNNFKRLDVSRADGIFSLFANRNGKKAEIKVWKSFDLASPEAQGFYIDSAITLVYDFSE